MIYVVTILFAIVFVVSYNHSKRNNPTFSNNFHVAKALFGVSVAIFIVFCWVVLPKIFGYPATIFIFAVSWVLIYWSESHA